MFQPLNFAEETIRRFHHKSGTVLASASACRSKSRTILARSRVSAALIGGGSTPRPGEISLAHNGVLFLDELPEFTRASVEGLRQPLEERSVAIDRVHGALRLPSSFLLVAAANS